MKIDSQATTVQSATRVLRQQRRLIWLLTAAALLILFASVADHLALERRQDLANAAALNQQRVGLLAADLTQTTLLARVAIGQQQALLKALGPGSNSPSDTDFLLRDQSALLSKLPIPFEIHALDAQGHRLQPGLISKKNQRLGTGPRLLLPELKADRWHVGLPQGEAGLRRLPLLQRAESNDRGVVAFVADIDHAALLRRYAGERLPVGGSAALFRIEEDGSISELARLPEAEVEVGNRERGTLAQALVISSHGALTGLTRTDGVDRIVAYERLSGAAKELVVVIGAEKDVVLATWNNELPLAISATLLLAAAIFWGGHRLTWVTRSLELGQQALEHSESDFRELVTNLPDVVARLDTDGRHHFVSAAVEQATGLPPSAFIGKTIAEMGLPEVGVKAWAETLTNAFKSGQTERIEFAFPGPNGVRHWESLVTPEPLRAGSQATALIISRDITERIQQAAALRQVDATLAALVDGSTNIIFVKDAEGRYVLANRAAALMLGRPLDEVLGRCDHDLFEAEIADRFRANDLRVMQSRNTETYEESVVGAAGTQRMLTTKGALLVDGELAGVFGIAHDISERASALDQLRESEERLRLALDAANLGLYDLDLRTGKTLISPEYAHMLGYEADELGDTHFSWQERLHPDDRDEVVQANDDYIAGRTSAYRVEFRLRAKDGSWKWILSMGKVQERDASGVALRMLGIHTDITESKRAELALRQSELRFRLAASNGQVWENTLSDTEARPASELFITLGHPAPGGNDVAAALEAIVHPDDYREMKQAMARHFRHEGPYQVQFRAYDVEQNERWFETQGQAVWDENDRAVYMAGTTFEITARHQAQEEVRKLTAELEQRVRDRTAELARSETRLRQVNQDLESFTYSVSHDLKAPLRGIDGYSRLLLSEHVSQLDAEGRKFLDNIRQATQHMGALIDDLLSYSRLERREIVVSRVALAPLVEAVLANCRQAGLPPQALISVDLTPGISARADAQGLTIALRNLVDNAIKFSRDSEPPRVQINCSKVGKRVQLSISDNGLGFDMKYHDRLFNIFQRLHRSEDYPGTGVGLAIVRRAMERMGGRVWADSKLGQGATFTLELGTAD